MWSLGIPLAVLTMAERVKVYFQVTKPRIWWLLVFTAFAGMFAAAHSFPDPIKLGLGLLTVTLGTAGTEAISNYMDRDMDGIMSRTNKRPIPSGKISPAWRAAIFGSLLFFVALFSSLAINFYAFILLILGAFNYLIIYVGWAKRRTPLNIILGSFAGGAPVMIGYVTISGKLTAEAFILAALVIVWIPSHIWSLALRYKEDYSKARVPMLPVVISEEKAIRCIASTGIFLVIFSALIYLLGWEKYGAIYLGTATIIDVVIMYLALKLLLHPSRENAWRLFKFTSPYLALIFTAIIIDSLI